MGDETSLGKFMNKTLSPVICKVVAALQNMAQAAWHRESISSWNNACCIIEI